VRTCRGHLARDVLGAEGAGQARQRLQRRLLDAHVVAAQQAG
jgi:hypothetical protein